MIPLPCPFCGVKPALMPLRPDLDGNAWGAVACVNRRCPSYDARRGHGVRVEDGVDVSDERGSNAYKAAAVRRWNRRAPVADTSPQPVNETPKTERVAGTSDAEGER